MQSSQPSRLWDKGAPLNELMHRFTVGDDPVLDLEIVPDDCAASAAHARTLHRAGILTDADLAALLAALREIAAMSARGEFVIPPELEDCHTAIESHLTRICGDAGSRIHTGRSRNDQVATAMRLYLRRRTHDLMRGLLDLLRVALHRIERDGATPMPGYTHMQPAMPSSVGQWLHAIVEGAAAQVAAAGDLLSRLDSCPLGTGAGFGVPLPLDREFTARLLDFRRPQRSAIDVQNSRGLMELYFARLASDIGRVVEKVACDLMVMTTAEFGFMRLPESLTTGSSIMPQKRNPDILELMRAKAARLRSRVVELEWVGGKLPSSYHRDLQLTKEPAIRAGREALELLAVARLTVDQVEIDAQRMRAAMGPELYATRVALERAASGTPFRQAYRDVAAELRAGQLDVSHLSHAADPAATVSAELLHELREELASHESQLDDLLLSERQTRESVLSD